jgi:hypothetical protein
MDDLFNNKLFKNATVFESGYIAGFSQFDVSEIRFHLAPLTGGGEFEAATFVERGKRKDGRDKPSGCYRRVGASKTRDTHNPTIRHYRV